MGIGLYMSRKVDFSVNNLKKQLVVGFLLITMGNGMVTWGEKYIPSGVAALICSMMPIFTVIFNLVGSKTEKINLPIIGGMLLGFVGVALIFRDNIADLGNTSYLLGIGATFIATSSWALGSVYNKKRNQGAVNPIFNSGLQLMFGGIFLFIGSPFIDSYDNIYMVDKDALWALAYLVVFGSVAAYTAYMYALKELPVGLVSTYAYVNPLVAVIIGYLWASEQLTWFTGLSFISIMVGVYIVNYGYRKQQKEKATVIEKLENLTASSSAKAAIK
jgi:drug/metabolite transporter (DMT)-like permease